jgi:hypothetical protein
MELQLCKEKLVLPISYKEQLQVLLEKRIEITIKLRKFKYEGRFNLINGHDIINLCGGDSSNEIIKSLTINELVVYITTEEMLKNDTYLFGDTKIHVGVVKAVHEFLNGNYIVCESHDKAYHIKGYKIKRDNTL